MNEINELLELKAQYNAAKERAKHHVRELVHDINSKIDLLKIYGDILSDLYDGEYAFDGFIVKDDDSIWYVDHER